MKYRELLVAFIGSFVIHNVPATETENWTGEYADKKFMNGQAVFQLSLTQEGNQTVKIGFDAVYNNGRDCAPEAEGSGKIAGKGTLKFAFQDNHHNAGIGTITRAGDDVIVSLKATRVADPKCVVFYRDNIRLKPMRKK
jgi:uncharacterized protein with beta-barrel porin domain